jgi:hypothetical protein
VSSLSPFTQVMCLVSLSLQQIFFRGYWDLDIIISQNLSFILANPFFFLKIYQFVLNWRVRRHSRRRTTSWLCGWRHHCKAAVHPVSLNCRPKTLHSDVPGLIKWVSNGYFHTLYTDTGDNAIRKYFSGNSRMPWCSPSKFYSLRFSL